MLNEFDYKFKSKEDELYLANKEKIEINTKEPEYIKVVWGIGYKIEKDDK